MASDAERVVIDSARDSDAMRRGREDRAILTDGRGESDIVVGAELHGQPAATTNDRDLRIQELIYGGANPFLAQMLALGAIPPVVEEGVK